MKGWFDARVETAQGFHYLLHFYDPVRLQESIADELSTAPCFAEPGLVVIPTVTLEAIKECLRRLDDIHFFDSLVPQ